MARKTAAQVVEKYQRKMAAAQQDYAEGVASPKRDWEAATRSSENRYNNAVQEAIAEGRFGRGVQGKGTKWQERARSVGAQRYAAAAQTAAQAFGQVADKVLQIAYASSDRVQAMDNSTYEARKQRALSNMDYIRDAWRGS